MTPVDWELAVRPHFDMLTYRSFCLTSGSGVEMRVTKSDEVMKCVTCKTC